MVSTSLSVELQNSIIIIIHPPNKLALFEGAGIPKLSLLDSPSLKLTPDDAEALDLSILLLRLSTYKFSGEDFVVLSDLLPAGKEGLYDE